MHSQYRENPADMPCYKACASCSRCENKGRYAKCHACSGRNDPKLQRDPYDFRDRCRCSEGILQVVTKNGHFIQQKFPHNPYGGSINFDEKSQSERDWETFLAEEREKYGSDYDPVQFEDGTSTTDHFNKARGEK